MKFELIKYSVSKAEYNMSFDAKLANDSEKNGISYFRVYGWIEPSVTTGYFQHQDKSINFEYCLKNNIPVIKRPTGGKAILHDNDFTFSIVINNNLFNSTRITDYYKIVNTSLNSALNESGIPSELNCTKKKAGIKDPVCFNHTSDYEIEWNKKKIVGTAIRKFPSSTLIQGNLPIKVNYKLYSDIFNIQQNELYSSFCGLSDINNFFQSDNNINNLSDLFYKKICCAF
ncbi:hypothetical protein KA977_08710 [Candidatus Dependentiae bacterium]|nr:hypothetical protein [Candidatus Dependentiae bacterium]